MGEKMITTWEPDTCGCIVEYSWDSDTIDTPEIREHKFHGHSRRCSSHEHLWDEDVYNTVLEENQRKNITLGHAAEQTSLGVLVDDKSTPGRITLSRRVMRPEVSHSFFFTEHPEGKESGKPRILHLTFSHPLSAQDREKIQQRFPGLIQVH